MDTFEGYRSPFSWRYGTEAMRTLWSEAHKRRLWRRVWVALAKAQSSFGLVTQEQVKELEAHADDIDMEQAMKLEEELRHDLMAELKTYAAQCPSAGGVLHLGATSMDIEDNADALRIKESLLLIRESLARLLAALASTIERYAELPAMAFTHLQPAEPTTLGYRYANYAQDLCDTFEQLDALIPSIKGKGFKGAVGTSASYGELIGVAELERFESLLATSLGLEFFEAATQTYPRIQDYRCLSLLAELGAILHKMALDFRVLQIPLIGEVSEPFGKRQVGSSAMPFKRNPIESEKIDSLARLLATYPQVAWSDAALSGLERTLDDSANRRVILPESFLACDELLRAMIRIVEGQRIDEEAVTRTAARFAPFSATERILMAMGKRGADRQAGHERLRDLAMVAWEAVQRGEENPLLDLVLQDAYIASWLTAEEIRQLFDVGSYTGAAAHRARKIAARARSLAERHAPLPL